MLEVLVLVVIALVVTLLEEIAAEETVLGLALEPLGHFRSGEIALEVAVVSRSAVPGGTDLAKLAVAGPEEIDLESFVTQRTQLEMELGQRLPVLRAAEAELIGEMLPREMELGKPHPD
jgi:hypothetical protein